jgi:hypothetical protein
LLCVSPACTLHDFTGVDTAIERDARRPLVGLKFNPPPHGIYARQAGFRKSNWHTKTDTGLTNAESRKFSGPHCTAGVEEVESVENVDYTTAKLADKKGDIVRLIAGEK